MHLNRTEVTKLVTVGPDTFSVTIAEQDLFPEERRPAVVSGRADRLFIWGVDSIAAAKNLLRELEVDFARFSRKAGCSCGCSPGFLLNRRLRRDVFVTAELVTTEAAE